MRWGFFVKLFEIVYVRAEFISLRSIPPGCDLEGQPTEAAACEKENIKEKKKMFYRVRWRVRERDAERWTMIQSGSVCERECVCVCVRESVWERERERERERQSMRERDFHSTSPVYFLVSTPPFLCSEISSKSSFLSSLFSTYTLPCSVLTWYDDSLLVSVLSCHG